MRPGSVVKVTRDDRLRVEGIAADRSALQNVWRAKTISPPPMAAARPSLGADRAKPVVWAWQAQVCCAIRRTLAAPA